MEIKQFEDKSLAHYSYAIFHKGAVVLIDPARNPEPYYRFAEERDADITAVLETHPHADFISSHLEIHHTTGAVIFCSSLLGASYPHQTLDEGQFIKLGDVKIKAWNTPGHSPDSVTFIFEDESGKDKAAFTGDTLFIGDCGRPDLREKSGSVQQKKEELSRKMYHSLKRFLTLNEEVVIYPAHGSGSLCGRSLSDQSSNTIGNEKRYNWCLQEMDEEDFVVALNKQQPFVPLYFPYDVELNTKGAPSFQSSIGEVPFIDPVLSREQARVLDPGIMIIDTRDQEQFKRGHLDHAINIQNEKPFETWLGSIIAPRTPFYLAGENEEIVKSLIGRVAKIGYESFIKSAFVTGFGGKSEPTLDLRDFRRSPDKFTIIDVRNKEEVTEQIFKNGINIPLPELKDRLAQIPREKPVVVHCASGFRSAIGSSILSHGLPRGQQVFDLGEAIQTFL